MINRWVEPRYRATGQSLLYAAYFGAGVIAGNFWTGYLAESKWRMTEVFWVNAGIVLLIGIILALALRKRVTDGAATTTD
jgi:MFS family permease